MKNNKKGFTLVELVIVVAVMAILVAVAIPTVKNVTTNATNAVKASNADTIESMLKLEMAEKNKNTLNEAEIAQALVNAKLGITEGDYYFDANTGAVSATSTTGVKITFTATGVTAGAETKNYTITPEATTSTPSGD